MECVDMKPFSVAVPGGDAQVHAVADYSWTGVRFTFCDDVCPQIALRGTGGSRLKAHANFAYDTMPCNAPQINCWTLIQSRRDRNYLSTLSYPVRNVPTSYLSRERSNVGHLPSLIYRKITLPCRLYVFALGIPIYFLKTRLMSQQVTLGVILFHSRVLFY